MRSGKEKWTRAMIKKFDEVAGAANVSAERANGFRKRSDLNIDATVNFEMVDGAAAIFPEHAGSMGIIDHHDRAIFFGKIAQSGQRSDVAVHRENAISDKQFLSGLIGHAGEFSFGVGNVLVLEDENFCAREARAIDDGSMIELVGDDEILFTQDGRDCPGVRSETGLENHASL